jgi:hypothetical protein
MGADRPKSPRAPLKELEFARRPAIGRTTVSSPALMKCLQSLNAGKCYAEQIKPFNFLQTCHVSPLGHPDGVDEERFHLVTPYNSDPRCWLDAEWIDQYTGQCFRITTQGNHGSKRTARVKTYGDVVAEYRHHPESKCADACGSPCGKQTVGLLQRRHIRIDRLKFIGKESNSLELVGAGLVHSAKSAYTEYLNPKYDEWITELLPALKKIPLRVLVEKCRGQLSRRALIDLRARRSRPRKRNREFLKSILDEARPIEGGRSKGPVCVNF